MIKTINEEIYNFENKSIKIVDGFDFRQKETIKKIYLYYNSKYESGEFDSQGDKKYFYNIGRVPCNIGTKAIDFDTKDIRIQTTSGGNPIRTWFFERDLKFWMKDKNFGKTLNRIFYELPIFGSVVLKVIDNIPYFVDLRNFIVEQNADSLDKSNYIIEIHNYTPVEFKKLGKKNNWANVDKAIEEFRKMTDTQYIKVYERYGEVKDGENYTYKRVTMADVGVDEDIKQTGEMTPHSGVMLQEEEVDKHPYREFHWEKIPGRWLGVGRIEVLFDPQMRVNEISNQEVKSSYWSTLRIWQTRDEGVNRNLLTDVDNGEILNVEDDIKQVDMADRNLAYYQNEITRWLSNRDELTFSHDPMKGARGAASTTLGATQIATAQAGSYFEQIQENIAMTVKEMLYEVIIPNFKRQNNKAHNLRIAGEDLDYYNELVTAVKTRKTFIDYVKRTGKIPSSEEYEILKTVTKENEKKGKEKSVTIPDEFYKNIKYKIDIIITGEASDTRMKAANLFAVLQAITADPTILQDPAKKKILFQYMEQGGLNPYELDMPQETQAPQIRPQMGGGGVSRPQIPQTPVAGTNQQQI